MYWLRRYFKPTGHFDGDWHNHIGELVTCRYGNKSGLHVGVVTAQGVYHAYRIPGMNSGDTVITAFNMMSRFKRIRFYSFTNK